MEALFRAPHRARGLAPAQRITPFALYSSSSCIGRASSRCSGLTTEARTGSVAAHNEVYAYDDAGRRTGVYAKRRAELVSFTRIWFRNLRTQGFLGEGARRELIA